MYHDEDNTGERRPRQALLILMNILVRALWRTKHKYMSFPLNDIHQMMRSLVGSLGELSEKEAELELVWDDTAKRYPQLDLTIGCLINKKVFGLNKDKTTLLFNPDTEREALSYLTTAHLEADEHKPLRSAAEEVVSAYELERQSRPPK